MESRDGSPKNISIFGRAAERLRCRSNLLGSGVAPAEDVSAGSDLTSVTALEAEVLSFILYTIPSGYKAINLSIHSLEGDGPVGGGGVPVGAGVGNGKVKDYLPREARRGHSEN